MFKKLVAIEPVSLVEEAEKELHQYAEEVVMYDDVPADDDEIIRLRENIRRAAEAKVENGTLTVTDLLREITNENLARRTKALHEVQLLMNIWQLKYTLNN